MLKSQELTIDSLKTVQKVLQLFFPPDEFHEYLDVFKEFLESGEGIFFKTNDGIAIVFYEIEEKTLFRVDEIFARGNLSTDQFLDILRGVEKYAKSKGCSELEITIDLTQAPVTALQLTSTGLNILSWEFEKAIPFPDNLKDVISLIRNKFTELLEFEIMFENGDEMELIVITSLAEAEEHMGLGKIPLLLTVTMDDETASSFHEATKDVVKWDSVNVVFSKSL